MSHKTNRNNHKKNQIKLVKKTILEMSVNLKKRGMIYREKTNGMTQKNRDFCFNFNKP
jgi:hypothetical protein